MRDEIFVMITPFFNISQDEEFIHIEIEISHIRFNAKTIEMVVNGPLFIFSLPPYYLRLKFPYNCIEDERSHSEFDSKDGVVRIKVAKEIKGQDFPDLDITARLLARTNESQINSKPLIEELDGDSKILEEGERFNWEISQTEPTETILHKNYGFDNQYSGIVQTSIANGNDINELGDPENTDNDNRILERMIKENIKFDPEYYASEYIMESTPEYQSLLSWKNPLVSQFLKWYKNKGDDSVMPVEFTKFEQEKMMDLTKKSYLVSKQYENELAALLISLMFSYHFDLRENEGEHTSESGWTVGKLTAQFCFLDNKLSVDDDDNILKTAIITSIRRSLCYPLHRNFKLSIKVWNDVYYNLRGGRRLVIKSLIAIKELFRFHDIYYVYDKIWLQDLLSWFISNVTESNLRVLAHDLKRELDVIKREDIMFEKVNQDNIVDSDDEAEPQEVNEEEEMVLLNIREIEIMADSVAQN